MRLAEELLQAGEAVEADGEKAAAFTFMTTSGIAVCGRLTAIVRLPFPVSLCGNVLFEHDMKVRAAETEGAHAGTSRARQPELSHGFSAVLT